MKMADPNLSIPDVGELSDAFNPLHKGSKKKAKSPITISSDVSNCTSFAFEKFDPKNMNSRATVFFRPAPFSDEPEAVAERKKCDYSIKITKEMAENGKVLPRPVRVYADGIYDLFHQGHGRQLMQAKNVFSEVYLIVGMHNDALTHQIKGKTVMTDKERYECMRHCRYVDEVYRDAPWVINEKFLEDNKIDFVAHDAIPYTMGSETNDVYQHLKNKGIFIATERTEGISTSGLINRIIQDINAYARRNLNLGYKGEDKNKNISFLDKENSSLENKMVKCVNSKEKNKNLLM